MLEELLAEADQNYDEDIELRRAERRRKAKGSFAYFCKTYLPQAFPLEFAEYQTALIDVVSKRTLSAEHEQLFKSVIAKTDHDFIKMPNPGEQLEAVLDIEPRDHGKTTRNTQALPLWIALNFPGEFPVLCAASKDSATDMLDAIKSALEDNDAIIDDYGVQKVKGNTWSKKKIQLANGSAIAAVGAGQTLRGIKNKFQRPTHVICDDLLKDDEVESRTQRDKIYKWFKRVILNLGKGALTIIANTIMHPDDLPSRLLNEIAEGQLENWLGLRFSAVVPNENGDALQHKDINEHITPLWPERWSVRDIIKKARDLGSSIFSTEWLNQPLSDEERKFHEEWIEYYAQLPIDVMRRLKIIMAVDPATGTKDGDFSAIVVVGYDPETGVYYVLYAWIERKSDLQLAYKIIEVFKVWKPKTIWFEDVVFQKIYKKMVAREAAKMSIRLPLKSFKGGNKDLRIQSLAPYIENGVLQFKEEQTRLVQQILNYPKDHDDGPDALEMCISKLENSGGFVGGSTVGHAAVRTIAQKISAFTGGYR
ncbi:phage terminase large subunit [Pseudoalteromonas sp. JBTF-M23]|uniref:Phage terminase large subunit n=1 Tax=Pseudoalteromonas caenipelagi TaxID=2726988 RepID=A0A849VE21_9GAMM|nr:phage terminase large subunit [Pseudoalteromonas caenipelagi]NOU49977.1 phage terminase large subunit [Pseudoalteromonas caenipelagi]